MSVTEFLLRKWSKGFRMVDADKDGYWTVKDFELFADFISTATNSGPEAAMVTKSEWVKWYHRIQPDPSVDRVDEKTYKDTLAKMFNNKYQFKAFLADSFYDLFDNLDLNKDGDISWEELSIFYAGFGVTDKKFVKKVFDTIDQNGNGDIGRTEFVDAFVQFWSEPNEPDKFGFIYDRSATQMKVASCIANWFRRFRSRCCHCIEMTM